MVMIDMLNLVPKHTGQLVLARHLAEKPETDKNMAARQGESVYQVGIGDEMETIGKRAMGACGNKIADSADILLDSLHLSRVRGLSGEILFRQILADANLALVRKPCQVHRHS